MRQDNVSACYCRVTITNMRILLVDFAVLSNYRLFFLRKIYQFYFCSELGVPFFMIAAPEIVSGMSGESEAKIRGLFNEAAAKVILKLFQDEFISLSFCNRLQALYLLMRSMLLLQRENRVAKQWRLGL